jgi:alpha-tubulin suppressor-like RCC1 family protein
VAIAVGGFHNLALKSDGAIAAWGSNAYGEGAVPAGLSGLTAIAAGLFHNLALKSDGPIVAWGAGMTNNPGDFVDNGQSIVPAGLSNVVGIAAGWYHSLAVKSDGTVAAWGAGNPSNPNNPTDLFDWGQSVVPAGVDGVVAVAAGSWHSLALVGGPRLAPPAPQPDGSMELILTGIPGWTYTVDVSSDLVNWTPLGSFVSTNSVTPFPDAAANNFSRRFYRAVAP